MTSAGDRCILVTRSTEYQGQFALMLCNGLGTVIENRMIETEPEKICMNQYYVVCVCNSGNLIYVWNYRAESESNSLLNGTKIAEALDGKFR
jgi:hypothetical protein